LISYKIEDLGLLQELWIRGEEGLVGNEPSSPDIPYQSVVDGEFVYKTNVDIDLL
jgi:hypothetical protein